MLAGVVSHSLKISKGRYYSLLTKSLYLFLRPWINKGLMIPCYLQYVVLYFVWYPILLKSVFIKPVIIWRTKNQFKMRWVVTFPFYCSRNTWVFYCLKKRLNEIICHDCHESFSTGYCFCLWHSSISRLFIINWRVIIFVVHFVQIEKKVTIICIY